MGSEDMPPVNFKKEGSKLSLLQHFSIDKISKFNVKRVSELRVTNKRANIFGLSLGAFVLSVYGYTMYAVRQETFLDDLEVPEAYVSQIQSS